MCYDDKGADAIDAGQSKAETSYKSPEDSLRFEVAVSCLFLCLYI